MFKKIIITSLGIAIAATSASAIDRGDRKEMRKEMQKEMEKVLAERFKEQDLNKDGAVTHDELMHRVKTAFGQFDTNGDGNIEYAELPDDLKQVKIALQGEKVYAMQQEIRKKMKERRKEIMEKRGMDPDAKMGHEGRSKPTKTKMIARMDKNGDDMISLEEFSAPALKRFKSVDLNGDGAVTMKESKKAMEQKKKKMKERMKKRMKKRMKEERRGSR